MQHVLKNSLLWLPVFAFLFTTTVTAAEFSAGLWPADGSTKWRIDFPTTGTTSQASGVGASELTYPHSGTYITAHYQSTPTVKGYFTAEGGFMKEITAAVGSDADWNYANNNQYWYYGNFKTTGSSSYLNVSWHKPTSTNTEIFYGYSYRNNHFQMTNGLYTVDNYQSVNNPLPLLNSTYNITYQGPHIGTITTKKLSSAVSAIGSLTYTPLALVQGHGWWNLRALDFDHLGPGHMMDAQVGMRYSLPKTAGAITIGYRYQWLDIYTGSENTSSTITWDKAVTVQKGLYFTGQIRF